MKKLIPILVMLTGIASAQAAPASNPSLDDQRAACFAQHKNLMEKPALRNERACWQAHAYLMDRK
jgi:hypothetical protein